MQTRTICCKLFVDCNAKLALNETSEQFAQACNYTLEIAISQKTSNAITLHHLCYKVIRQSYNLSANLAIRAIHRVAAAMKKLKGKRKCPRNFRPKSISYDARIFSYFEEKEMISLTTTGRIKIPLLLGEHQRRALKGQKPTSATLIKRGDIWYIHISIDYEPVSSAGSQIMGVDLGINNLAATSTRRCFEGKSRRAFKEKRAAVRASLQSKNTRGAKKVLQRLSGYEKRRIRTENHILSKQLIEEAKRHDCVLFAWNSSRELEIEQRYGINISIEWWQDGATMSCNAL